VVIKNTSVGKVGVRVDLKNIEAMKYFPHPKTLISLRGFLGLTCYYRKFLRIMEILRYLSLLFVNKILSLGIQQLLRIFKP
jgi:hypothetical protein